MARRPSRGAPRRTRDETGASLILALVFLIVVSLIVISMATWTATGLRSSIRFTAAQSTVATANSVTEVAVSDARVDFEASTINASPPVPCLSAAYPTQNDVSMNTWCSTQWNQQSVKTRVVTFSTCLASVSATDCQAHPLLQAIVTYNDFPTTNNYASCAPVSTLTTTTTTVAGTSSCGTGMKINTWVFAPTPPVVATASPIGVIPLDCSAYGTNPVQVTGSGFTSPASVTFVVPSSPSNYSTSSLQAPLTKVISTTLIYACEPVYSGSQITVNVVVSTPTGTSAILGTSSDQVTLG